jgi:ubiquinone biosynthesis protein UbiJ
MATQSPFSLLDDLLKSGSWTKFTPPAWLVDEGQRRLVLLLNHVLMQEPEAMVRLKRQSGRVMRVQWQGFFLVLKATPAGLLDLADPESVSDLQLTLTETSPLAMTQTLMRGDKPAIRIEGDVQLAADVSWLTDHVRWDLEEDLARLMGDVPAHALTQIARAGVQAVQQFATKAAAFASKPGRP